MADRRRRLSSRSADGKKKGQSGEATGGSSSNLGKEAPQGSGQQQRLAPLTDFPELGATSNKAGHRSGTEGGNHAYQGGDVPRGLGQQTRQAPPLRYEDSNKSGHRSGAGEGNHAYQGGDVPRGLGQQTRQAPPLRYEDSNKAGHRSGAGEGNHAYQGSNVPRGLGQQTRQAPPLRYEDSNKAGHRSGAGEGNHAYQGSNVPRGLGQQTRQAPPLRYEDSNKAGHRSGAGDGNHAYQGSNVPRGLGQQTRQAPPLRYEDSNKADHRSGAGEGNHAYQGGDVPRGLGQQTRQAPPLRYEDSNKADHRSGAGEGNHAYQRGDVPRGLGQQTRQAPPLRYEDSNKAGHRSGAGEGNHAYQGSNVPRGLGQQTRQAPPLRYEDRMAQNPTPPQQQLGRQSAPTLPGQQSFQAVLQPAAREQLDGSGTYQQRKPPGPQSRELQTVKQVSSTGSVSLTLGQKNRGQQSVVQGPNQQHAVKPPAQSGGGEPAELVKKMSDLSLVPKRQKRPQTPKKGRWITVETNHLELKIKNRNMVVHHYDVAINPERPYRLYRKALELVQKMCYPNQFPAFDGKKNLYSYHELPFKSKELVETVEVLDNEKDAMKELTVTIKYAKPVNIGAIWDYLKCGSSLNAPQDVIQALDIVLRQPAVRCLVPVGRSFFSPPPGRPISLGDGVDLWYGSFQSMIIGWKPYLNLDGNSSWQNVVTSVGGWFVSVPALKMVLTEGPKRRQHKGKKFPYDMMRLNSPDTNINIMAHKGFPAPENCVRALANVIHCSEREFEDPNFQMRPYHRDTFVTFIKNLKVVYEIPRAKNKRTFKVFDITTCPRDNRFLAVNKETNKSSEMTVQAYFQSQYKYNIRYPHLPCLVVGSKNKPISLPLELCRIVEGQVTMQKLNEIQTRSMVKEAAVDTERRKQKIMKSLQHINYNADPCMREFGLSVADKFTKVDARILNAPTVDYRENMQVTVVQGVWRNQKFMEGAELINWHIMNTSRFIRDQDITTLANGLIHHGRVCGMNISNNWNYVLKERLHDIENYFQQCQKNGIQLLIIILPDKGAVTYGTIKKCAEIQVGILTQCLKTVTVKNKLSPSTFVNILQKVNAKLNGINHYVTPNIWPKFFHQPVMVVGADVTHPSPDQLHIPSIAAVAASHDIRAFKYNMIWKLQPPREEVIKDLKEIMREQLMTFYRSTKHKPNAILFYRDGVSEGQFRMILDVELNAIRQACTSLQQNYTPPITFLVVQKRHHTRFFPEKKDADGRNKNVPAGTVVDTEITHPTELDFYLVSHASIQGTARPTKYHLLWDDADMSEQDLEEITYYLCHLFTRCTRSVSYPAPTYYAHLAAFRARSYMEMEMIMLDKLDQEQSRRQVKDAVARQNPMYFV